MDAVKLGQYLALEHPGARARQTSRGVTIVGDAPEVSKETLAEWVPPAPDPDKVPAPSLEVRDYKILDAALEAASTVAQVKAVFRQYLRRRAGL